jgi:hypothetical protein
VPKQETDARAMPSKREPESEYHGIIVEESLREPSILRSVSVLGRKRGRDWTLLRVGVSEGVLQETIESVRRNLKVVNGVPFYAHFYRSGELIVVFPDRVFRITPNKDTWAQAVNYGKSVGIPLDQLDFLPCRFEDETY